MNVGVYVSFQLAFSFSSDRHPQAELLDHMTVPFLIFWGTSIRFPIATAPLDILIRQCTRVPLSPQPHQHFFISCPLENKHSNRYEVVSHCGFNVHFPDSYWCWASFHAPVGHLHLFFRKMSTQSLFSFVRQLDYLGVFLLLSPLSSSHILDLTIYQIYDLETNIFSHSMELPLHFVDGFVAVQKFYCLMGSQLLFLLLLPLHLFLSNPIYYCQNQCQGAYYLYFPMSFMVLGLASS